MFKLFYCEWMRLRKIAILSMLVHLVCLGLLINFGLFSSDSIGFKITLVLLYCLSGYLLGNTQIKKYTNNNHWTYFINRPIHSKQVYLALLFASLLFIIIVIIIPFFIVTLVLDTFNMGIIDIRHYHQLAYLMGMTLLFYLLACYITLSQKKTSFYLMIIVLLPIISINVGGSVYWLLLGVIAVMMVMTFSLIKANLDGLHSGFLNQSVTAIALQFSVYFLLISVIYWIGAIVFDISHRTQNNSQLTIGDAALNSQHFKEIIFLKNQDSLVTALHTEDNKYQDLIEEIQLNKTERIRKRIWFHPNIQQLPFMDENKTIVVDDENQIVWQFSHDLMLFVGKKTINQKIIGYLGPDRVFKTLEEITKDQVFTAVPWVSQDQIVVKNSVYQYQNINGLFRLLFSTADNEYLLNGLQDQGSVKTIITNKNLYIFDSIDYKNNEMPLKEVLKMPLPNDYNNIWDMKISEIDDGFILSALIGKSNRHDVYQAEQLAYHLNLSGEYKRINQRPLIQTPPYIIKNMEYYLSPAWKLLLDHFPLHPSRDRYLEQRPQVQSLPQSTLMTLLLLTIFYALITLYIARKRSISLTKKMMWSLLNTVLGVPGIYSFLLLNPKSQHIDKTKIKLADTNEVQHV